MFLRGDHKATGKFIVYADYGLQSHIIMNHVGVSFTCNPLKVTTSTAKVFDSKEEANLNTTEFYNRVAEVQLILAISAFELNIK